MVTGPLVPLTPLPRCFALIGVNTGVRGPRLRLDLLDRQGGDHVERSELPGAVGICMLGDGLERRRERRVGDDQETGHNGSGRVRFSGQADRAEEGVERLSRLISRLSEGTRLERMLESTERERFDIAALVAGCVEGYRAAYPGRRFELTSAAFPVWLVGVPDAVAQLRSGKFARPGAAEASRAQRSTRPIEYAAAGRSRPR